MRKTRSRPIHKFTNVKRLELYLKNKNTSEQKRWGQMNLKGNLFSNVFSLYFPSFGGICLFRDLEVWYPLDAFHLYDIGKKETVAEYVISCFASFFLSFFLNIFPFCSNSFCPLYLNLVFSPLSQMGNFDLKTPGKGKGVKVGGYVWPILFGYAPERWYEAAIKKSERRPLVVVGPFSL